MEKKKRIKASITVEGGLWAEFMAKVFKRRGKTSGGAVSESLEEAIRLWLKQK